MIKAGRGRGVGLGGWLPGELVTPTATRASAPNTRRPRPPSPPNRHSHASPTATSHRQLTSTSSFECSQPHAAPPQTAATRGPRGRRGGRPDGKQFMKFHGTTTARCWSNRVACPSGTGGGTLELTQHLLKWVLWRKALVARAVAFDPFAPPRQNPLGPCS